MVDRAGRCNEEFANRGRVTRNQFCQHLILFVPLMIHQKSTQNAIAAMSRLAELYGVAGAVASSREVAQSRNLSVPLVGKILTDLSRAGLVTGSRAPLYYTSLIRAGPLPACLAGTHPQGDRPAFELLVCSDLLHVCLQTRRGDTPCAIGREPPDEKPHPIFPSIRLAAKPPIGSRESVSLARQPGVVTLVVIHISEFLYGEAV